MDNLDKYFVEADLDGYFVEDDVFKKYCPFSVKGQFCDRWRYDHGLFYVASCVELKNIM